jgi:hypothetical protein
MNWLCIYSWNSGIQKNHGLIVTLKCLATKPEKNVLMPWNKNYIVFHIKGGTLTEELL